MKVETRNANTSSKNSVGREKSTGTGLEARLYVTC